MASTYEDYISQALSKGTGLLSQSNPAYPDYVSSQTKAPTQMDYVTYTPTSPLATVNAPTYQYTAGESPGYQNIGTNVDWNNWNFQNYSGATPTWNNYNYSAYSGADPTASQPAWSDYAYKTYDAAAPAYQGLMGGDYEALQKALTTPGELSAKTAYDQGLRDLTSVMGGNGLYGSSIMSTQANEKLNKVYQDTLATNAANAAATRYGMQQTDLTNASAQELQAYLAKLGENTTANSLMSEQNIAKNQNATTLSGQALQSYLARLNESTELQKAAGTQNIAANEQGFNTWNSLLGQNTTGQQLGAAQNIAMNQAGQLNADRALSQSQSGNTFAQNAYDTQVSREQDLNQFAAQLYPTMQQAANDKWESERTANQDQLSYDTSKLNWDKSIQDSLTDWENKKLYEKYQYDLANRADQTTFNQNQLTGLLNTGQLANTATGTSNTYNAALQALATNQDTANTAGLYSLGGTALGGLLSGNNLSTIGGLLSSILGSGSNYAGGTSQYDWSSLADQDWWTSIGEGAGM
jgi:hypothetical protein